MENKNQEKTKRIKNIEKEDQKEKKKYESPMFESHSPLKIMSAYEDRTSELPF